MSEDAAVYGGGLTMGNPAEDARAVLRGEGVKIAARATAWAEQLLQHATEGDLKRFAFSAGELARAGRRAQFIGDKLTAKGGGQ